MNTFQQCIKDKIYRLESRLTPGELTDENMKKISFENEMQIYRDCLAEINGNSKTFSFGIVVEMVRIWDTDKIAKTLEDAAELAKSYPDLIIGLDLVGDEDNFPSFKKLSGVMLWGKQKQKEIGVDIPWILHCGESLRITNENPIDGYLLDAKRFGHGISLYKHSYLLDIIKDNNICIEINPISNQTLKNVRDLRMHPAVGYLNEGINICINNDDPTLYNTTGVNYDFFVAAVCCEFDLFDLKVLVLNSIKCSEAKEKEKERDCELLSREWNQFIADFITKYE